MVAALLYLIGLVTTLVTLVVVGFSAPALFDSYTAAAADNGILPAIVSTARFLEWALWPFVGGLVLMALARIVVLLASIDRSLRGNP